ncbi:MAG TPA: hypothetical protein VI136_18885 [Verrucomicrobiae bacterium]
MILVQLIEFLRKRLKAVVWACCGVLGLLVVLDIVRHFASHHEAVEEHIEGFWGTLYRVAENVPGFWSVFGFVACVLIIILSKWYGHAGIMQREDYYDDK